MEGVPGCSLEVCVESMQSVEGALEGFRRHLQRFGGSSGVVFRLELCAALSLGGLTPSAGFALRAAREAARFSGARVATMALIRPREGNFVYDRDEIDVMLADIRGLPDEIDGVVVGALTKSAEVHAAHTAELALAAAARGFDVTFHRAIDVCDDIVASTKIIAQIPHVSRILTSGGQRSAVEGADTIALMAKVAREMNPNFTIMAGAGIAAAEDVAKIARATLAMHGSFRSSAPTDSMGEFERHAFGNALRHACPIAVSRAALALSSAAQLSRIFPLDYAKESAAPVVRPGSRSGFSFPRALKSTYTLQLTECASVTVAQNSDHDCLGAVVWDAAIVLCKALVGGIVPLTQSTCVLELGSGTGIVGLAASTLGAGHVVLTDRPAMVPMLRENAQANDGKKGAGVVKVAPLVWEDLGNWENERERAIDVVLGSDLLYEPDSFAALVATLETVMRAGSNPAVVVLAYKRRFPDKEHAFFEAVRKQLGLRIEVVFSAAEALRMGSRSSRAKDSCDLDELRCSNLFIVKMVQVGEAQ